MPRYPNGRTLRERLLSRLIIDSSGCLLWTGTLNGDPAHGSYGYGVIEIGGHTRMVHRIMYEMFVGPIPAGLQLDHLCRVRHCASPAILRLSPAARTTCAVPHRRP